MYAHLNSIYPFYQGGHNKRPEIVFLELSYMGYYLLKYSKLVASPLRRPEKYPKTTPRHLKSFSESTFHPVQYFPRSLASDKKILHIYIIVYGKEEI